jgi:MFS transporter, OFA family, oxalate/formate antiporter
MPAHSCLLAERHAYVRGRRVGGGQPTRSPGVEVSKSDAPNRWWITFATFMVMFPIGGIYAWSVFVEPLQEQFEWSWTQSMLPLMVNVALIFVGTVVGGWIQDRTGPRLVAAAGIVIYAAGVALSALATEPDQLWILVLGYGVIGGTGVGVAYITGPAMIVKWFPDKRGMAAGIATLGFGAGALLTAPLGEWLVEALGGVPPVFLVLAGLYLLLGLPFCFALEDPPEDWDAPTASDAVQDMEGMRQYELGDALRTVQWWALTAMLFVNTTIGIGLITLAQPITEEVTGAAAGTAAILVSVLGVWNGLGRPGLAALSDRTGRMRTFTGMFVVQAAAFAALPFAEPFLLFAVLASVIALCFGGGFGIMPAASSDFFGTEHGGAVFGAMIVAWSAAGVVGPLVVSELREATDGFETALLIFAGASLVTALLPVITKPPADRRPD